jgi:hypothetical protein
MGKADPRTFRFDVSYSLPASTSLRPTATKYNTIFSQMPDFMVNPGSLAKLAFNKTGGDNYTDLDGTLRPGDAYHGNLNPYEANVSTARPIVLNRPFRSVGELGYVFRDLPFKSLDFFTDKSADAALLDIFSVGDEPAIGAGHVSLQTPHAVVLQSLMSGADGITSAVTAAASYKTYASANPPRDSSELTSYAISSDPAGNTSILKQTSEAPVRALTGPSQTRTWNLLIDVVAQTGRYPAGATGAAGFLVEGERRYWISIAIDRYTGRIIDQQWEAVNEQ